MKSRLKPVSTTSFSKNRVCSDLKWPFMGLTAFWHTYTARHTCNMKHTNKWQHPDMWLKKLVWVQTPKCSTSCYFQVNIMCVYWGEKSTWTHLSSRHTLVCIWHLNVNQISGVSWATQCCQILCTDDIWQTLIGYVGIGEDTTYDSSAVHWPASGVWEPDHTGRMEASRSNKLTMKTPAAIFDFFSLFILMDHIN